MAIGWDIAGYKGYSYLFSCQQNDLGFCPGGPNTLRIAFLEYLFSNTFSCQIRGHTGPWPFVYFSKWGVLFSFQTGKKDTSSGWFWNICYFSISYEFHFIPTDVHIFQRGGQTTNQSFWDIPISMGIPPFQATIADVLGPCLRSWEDPFPSWVWAQFRWRNEQTWRNH